MTPLRFAACLVATALLAIWQVSIIPASPMYAVVGATLVPAVVVGMFSVCSILYVRSVLRQTAVDSALDPDQSPLAGASSRTVFFLLGGLLFVLTIKLLGFVVSATIAGMGIARAFDAQVNVKSAVICGMTAVFFWVLFDLLLGVDLGPFFPLLNKAD